MESFLDIKEPTNVGIDVMAGSLIKNPGGGLALTGGYVCGRDDLIEKNILPNDLSWHRRRVRVNLWPDQVHAARNFYGAKGGKWCR